MSFFHLNLFHQIIKLPVIFSQIYVSTAGMSMSTDAGGNQQVIFASASGDGTILEMVPSDGGSHQVVVSEAVLAAHGHGHQLDEQQQQHLQLVQHESSSEMQEVIHDQMGQPVQELHIVLDQQENRSEGQVVEQQEEGMEIVEVQQSESESFGEIQLDGMQQLDHTEASVETEPSDEANAEEQHETEIITEDVTDVDTQQIEIDENSQQLQIDEEGHTLKLDSSSIDLHSQDTQVVTEENLGESIELVEGQTLTLIEEEDGTQTLKVGDGTVEEVSSS